MEKVDWHQELKDMHDDFLDLISDIRDNFPKTDIPLEKAKKNMKSAIAVMKKVVDGKLRNKKEISGD